MDDPNSKQGRKRMSRLHLDVALDRVEQANYELSLVGTKNGSEAQRLLRSVRHYLDLAYEKLKEIK